MKTEMERTTQTPEDVLDELHALVSEAERILGQSREGSCACDARVAAVRERLEAAQKRLAAVYEDAKQKVVAGAKRADGMIRDHPYQTIAIAVGIGLLAGVLLGRRSNVGPQ